MAISPTFQRYLATKNVVYDIIVHEPTKSAMRTAEACRVSADRIAKAVVLRDEYGYVLAILPASHQIRVGCSLPDQVQIPTTRGSTAP